MKIFGSFISQRFKLLALTTITLLSLSYNIHAQEGDAVAGEMLFKANCASCHYPDERDMTGPSLKGAWGRWEENSSIDNLYLWVQNSQSLIKSGDGYANQLFNENNKSVMTPQMVDAQGTQDILTYIEGYVAPITDKKTEVAATEEESGDGIWWIIGILLLIVIGAVGTVGGNLSKVAKVEAGEEVNESETVSQSARKWAWNNRGWFGVLSVFVVMALLVLGMLDLMKIGVFENYKPEQPIAYSHEIHAGDLEIDCKYCHNAVTKSKHATIPQVNICMNCHKEVAQGRDDAGTAEIQKIYAAAGWDVDTRSYTGETQPIRWVKVHNLPDHVYFNHSQHVEVGGVECAQCHGDMKKETVARVMSTADLNAVPENDIKFSRPTLTMGWCIECHSLSNIDVAGSHISGAEESEDSYYGVIHQRLLKDKNTYQKLLDDDVISVAELGGVECAKCHY